MNNLRHALFHEAIRLIMQAQAEGEGNVKVLGIPASMEFPADLLDADYIHLSCVRTNGTLRGVSLRPELSPIVEILGSRLVFREALRVVHHGGVRSANVYVDLDIHPQAALYINDYGYFVQPQQ